jgi:uncharacterized repeat protein (TIGR03837 family)
MPCPKTVDLFCQVVDNFGDIGVCWRLARQLVAEHRLAVTLRVDDLQCFQCLCAEVDVDSPKQKIAGVVIERWRPEDGAWLAPIPDLVVEAFGCRLPEPYIARMAARHVKPVWINLEYLSAEPWVEGCHGLASPHPSLPLTKYFFFPGFSDRTGGLLVERDLASKRNAFQSSPQEISAFIARLTGQPCEVPRLKASLFCYPDAPVAPLLDTWQSGKRPIACIVPEGVARTAVEAFLAAPAIAGAHAQRGALSVHVVPFVDQPDYDRLLWACDINFVRGEDSFIRAQWAQRPFFWHIYPQDEAAHLIKLDAFLDRYVATMNEAHAILLRRAWHDWNHRNSGSRDGDPSLLGWWPDLSDSLPAFDAHVQEWSQSLWRNGDLASNLIRFASKFG